jgi:hypothetical protein
MSAAEASLKTPLVSRELVAERTMSLARVGLAGCRRRSRGLTSPRVLLAPVTAH